MNDDRKQAEAEEAKITHAGERLITEVEIEEAERGR